MRTKITMLCGFIWFCNHSFGQITMTEFDKKEKVEEKIIAQPKYDSSENFIDYDSYYLRLGQERKLFYEQKEKCSESLYYKRYIGLQIFYPPHVDNYDENYTFFIKRPFDKPLKWSDIGNRYYTILNIYLNYDSLPSEEKVYEKLMNDDVRTSKILLILILKDNITGDTIHSTFTPYEPTCILVPYFERLKQAYDGKTIIAYNHCMSYKLPRTEAFNETIEQGSLWKCKVTLLREKDLIFDQNSADNQSNDDIFIGFLLSDSQKTIYAYSESKRGEPFFDDCFMLYDSYLKMKNKENKNEEFNVNNLIQKYGKEFGLLISQHKVKIGMTKEMCEASWGVTLNIQRITTQSLLTEYWRYSGGRKLVFVNGVLTEIFN